MSGKPHPEGVAKAIALIQQVQSLNAEIRELETATAKLEDKRKYLGNAYRELTGLIAEMDLASSGNFGYENRMAWFLADSFYHQTKGISE